MTKLTLPASHNYLTATPKITFTFQKLLLDIESYEKSVSLINKLQPLSYQSTSNITPRLPLYTSQPTHKICNATALLTIIPNILKKCHVHVVQRRPNIRSHSVFFNLFFYSLSRLFFSLIIALLISAPKSFSEFKELINGW